MAVRLTVVISQARQGTSKQQTLEACLIAELIGRSGIDVSLIGPLSQVEQSTTERLVLEGISGDFALVAWQTAEETMAQLAALQISAQRSAHRADPQAGTEPGRRIYCFDWNRFSTAEELAASLGQLLNERRVVTVSLAPPPASTPSQSPPQQSTLPIAGSGSRGPTADPLPKAGPEGPPRSAANGEVAKTATPLPDEVDDERDRAANARLDALVDDLNMLDL